MKALFLSTPDLEATKLANLLMPWCNTPIQCFQEMQTGTELAGVARSVDNLHQDIFFDAQKSWFQLSSGGFGNIGINRPTDWSASTLSAIEKHDQWLISDARFCLTAPFWQSNFNPDALVIAYSDPLVCAFSLSRTWRFPISVGLALWEYYLLSAVNHCKNQTTIILSLYKFHHDRDGFNRLLAEQLATLGFTEDDTFEKIQSVTSPLPSSFDISSLENGEYLNSNQASLFAELEELDLESVAHRSLSSQSEDLLRHYGDLRAGYEKMKMHRNQIQQELNAIKADQSDMQVKKIKPDETAKESQDALFNPGHYVEVSVQVQDMQQLEFICSRDAPVLNTLQEVLQNPTEYKDQLLFLNYGKNGEQTLYFPGCSLLSLNVAAI
ncbi:MAG: hypothetical protein ACI8P9_001992 [Parasphingorhabdus sp.]|jgi:hypothetical protein